MEAAVGHPDGLAVVGFLLEAVDAPNPRFDRLVEGFERIKKSEHSIRVTSGWYFFTPVMFFIALNRKLITQKNYKCDSN